MKRQIMMAASLLLVAPLARLSSVEIPLESLSPARIGFVDLQKVFDTYPEKSFAEGDLLREIEKRKRELGQRQNLINTIRQQISADEAAFSQAQSGAAVQVPANNVPDQTPPSPPPPWPAQRPSKRQPQWPLNLIHWRILWSAFPDMNPAPPSNIRQVLPNFRG